MLRVKSVIYAKDAQRLADFYGEVLTLRRAEEDASFVRLAADGMALIIVQAPPALADGIVIADPPVVREETPIKLSFAVPDLEAMRPLVERLGGGLQQKAWSWLGETHLDGWDPEGNVFQLRQPAA